MRLLSFAACAALASETRRGTLGKALVTPTAESGDKSPKKQSAALCHCIMLNQSKYSAITNVCTRAVKRCSTTAVTKPAGRKHRLPAQASVTAATHRVPKIQVQSYMHNVECGLNGFLQICSRHEQRTLSMDTACRYAALFVCFKNGRAAINTSKLLHTSHTVDLTGSRHAGCAQHGLAQLAPFGAGAVPAAQLALPATQQSTVGLGAPVNYQQPPSAALPQIPQTAAMPAEPVVASQWVQGNSNLPQVQQQLPAAPAASQLPVAGTFGAYTTTAMQPASASVYTQPQ